MINYDQLFINAPYDQRSKTFDQRWSMYLKSIMIDCQKTKTDRIRPLIKGWPMTQRWSMVLISKQRWRSVFEDRSSMIIIYSTLRKFFLSEESDDHRWSSKIVPCYDNRLRKSYHHYDPESTLMHIFRNYDQRFIIGLSKSHLPFRALTNFLQILIPIGQF